MDDDQISQDKTRSDQIFRGGKAGKDGMRREPHPTPSASAHRIIYASCCHRHAAYSTHMHPCMAAYIHAGMHMWVGR